MIAGVPQGVEERVPGTAESISGVSVGTKRGSTMRCVGFGHGEAADELAQLSCPLDLAYRPIINDFRGRQNVELHLVDWRVTQALAETSK